MKKKMAIFALMGALVFMVNGCIPSIHPLYTADKLVQLKDLPGKWEEKMVVSSSDGPSGKPETWRFEAGEDKNYVLIQKDADGNLGAFDVHIVKLGKYYFMDFFPTNLPPSEKSNLKNPDQLSNFSKLHLLAVHTFAKMELTSNELKISMFDPEFLSNLLKNQQIRIKHEDTDNGFVLTASPAELQKFVEKYADVEEAFLDNPMVLKNKL